MVGNIVTGIVLGGQPIFGYNYGAAKLDRVRQTYRIVLLSSLAVGLTAMLIFQLWPELVINLFGAGDAVAAVVITCLTISFFRKLKKL